MNEQQKIEELLKPRFEVIADYPKSLYKIGEILRAGGQSEDLIYCDDKGPRLRDYPHLFKPLPWYAERSVEEMPEYVKNEEGEVFKIKEWDGTSVPYVFVNPKIHSGYVESATHSPLFPPYFPATESEYTAYINSKAK